MIRGREQNRMSVEVKTIGDEGQLSLGTEHAGRTVTVEQMAEGIWLIRAAQPVPENELWLHTPETAAALDRAIAWAEQNPARESDLEEFERKLTQRR